MPKKPKRTRKAKTLMAKLEPVKFFILRSNGNTLNYVEVDPISYLLAQKHGIATAVSPGGSCCKQKNLIN